MNQAISQEMSNSEFKLPLYYVFGVWVFCTILIAILSAATVHFTGITLATYVANIAAQLIWITVLLSVFRRYYSNWLAAAALITPKVSLKFCGSLLGYVVLLRASLLLLPIATEDLQWMEQHTINVHVLLVFLGLVILAPLAEELFYRQFLWQALQQQWQRPWLSISLTSATWALVHSQYTIVGMFHLFLFGLILGWSRHKTGSLWVPIGLHSLNNGLAFAALAIEVGS
ncbi:CPBP family intramembrane glutamic endopeptidase [Ferrimonas kyonanensis]|uniref:CPBP family intramembrane glutamic endopeptidase n=1 Tax=Ferrimonas kyonanensis TaxID=364763 RepID=UPI000483B836|nr:type II CAAX endopeptidase family protein [Ferrimonas kyonanensis]